MAMIDINRARSVLAKTNWEKRKEVATAHGHRVYIHDCLPIGFFYVEHDKELIVMGTESYLALSTDRAAVMGMIAYLAKRSGGIVYVDLTVGEYAHTVRNRAVEFTAGPNGPKDVIAELMERAQGLMVRAQSLGRSPSIDELAIFNEERSKLGEQVVDVAHKVKLLQVMFEMVTDAVLAS